MMIDKAYITDKLLVKINALSVCPPISGKGEIRDFEIGCHFNLSDI